MRVLIIGGTSFMGPAVVRRLVELGYEVTVFHRGESEADLPPEVRHLHGDRRRLPEHAGELRAAAPEIVLDMVLLREAEARDLLDVFRGVARRLVVASSVDVYRAYGVLIGQEPGPPDPVPLTEDAPLRRQLYPYRGMFEGRLDDYDKIPVERVVMSETDLPGTVVRLPMVYGPRDRQHRLFAYLKRMDDGRPAILLEEGLAAWRDCRGYVANMAEAITLAALDHRSAGRIYHVAEAEAAAEAEWVRRIGRAAGWRGEVVALPREKLPPHLASPYNWGQHLVLDSSRIRGELGYREVVRLDAAMDQTVAWERANAPPIDPAEFDYAAEDEALSREGINV